MNIGEFNAQMKRLSDTFGAQHFKQERLNLIFQHVRDFSQDWLRLTVDGFIASSRYAPLPGEFADAASAERERRWQEQKSRSKQEAAEFWSGQHYDTDDRRMIFDAIIKRMKFNKNSRLLELNAKSDEERAAIVKARTENDAGWARFIEMLEARARGVA